MMTEEGFHREWYDDTDPPDRGIRLQEEDTCKAWSDLQPGDRVRWKTATFVKRGCIVSVSKRSMSVLFDAHSKPTVIPDGKWYFVEGKVGNINEHLVTISTPANPDVKMNGDPRQGVEHRPAKGSSCCNACGEPWPCNQNPPGVDDAISPAQAANILGTDAKNVRRMIRSGKLQAHRDGGRWVLSRSQVES